MGDYKVVRQGLKTKKPGPWEVYDLNADPGESHDLSKEHPEVIEKAVTILRQEVGANDVFPMAIPDVTPGT
jgi:hypothetical protein